MGDRLESRGVFTAMGTAPTAAARSSIGRLRAVGLTVFLLAAAAGTLAAQEAPALVTDRPTAAASTSIVSRGFVQWETGVKFARDEGGGSRDDSLDVVDSLIRIGLSDRVELRIAWLPYAKRESTTAAGSSDASGIGDGSLGVKIRLRSEVGAAPEVALLLGTTLPVGDDEITADKSDPFATLAGFHGLSETLGLVYNVGVDSVSRVRNGDNQRDLDLSYSGALSIGGGPAAGFVELFGETAIEGTTETTLSVGGGVTYLARPNLQLDASAGAGLTDSATDWFVSAGLSWRFPR